MKSPPVVDRFIEGIGLGICFFEANDEPSLVYCSVLGDEAHSKTYFAESGRLFQETKVSRGLDEAMVKLASIERRQGHLDLADQALRVGVPDISFLLQKNDPRAGGHVAVH